MNRQTIGKKTWVIVGGHIPLHSTGHEPECTSFDQLCVLNTTDREAKLSITIYYADREPVGPYPLKVQPRRTRHVRFNDLIDPQAIPLDTDYAAVVQSSVPVVVQFIRQDTGQAAKALLGTLAFSAG